MTGYYIGIPCDAKKPTLDHVPAIWECMLGTVYARNPVTKEIRYFDYDYAAAKKFVGIDGRKRRAQDLRLYRCKSSYWSRGPYPSGPSVDKLTLWIKVKKD